MNKLYRYLIDTITLKQATMIPFSQDELKRYSRHFAVSKIGIEGQKKLKSSSALLVGAGGIGSPAALYLGANGIGTIGIVDDDVIELSNLHRQILYTENQVGQSKAKVAQETLQAQNPAITVHAYNERLTQHNGHEIISQYDVIIDGSDNYETRYLVSDICTDLKKPLVSSSIYQFTGQIMTLCCENTPCYRCIFPDPPPADLIPNCATAGVLGIVPGIMGILAALEAIKLILQLGDTLVGKLALFDALNFTLSTADVKTSAHCPICHDHIPFSELHRNINTKIPNNIDNDGDIMPSQLKAFMDQGKDIVIIDVREDYERQINHIAHSTHIPLSQIDQARDILPKDKLIILYCKKGSRSQTAQKRLQACGYSNVYNLVGGIDLWIEQIDPTQSQY